MRNLRLAVFLAALAVLGAAQLWLARVDERGPARRWLDLPGGVPAILYRPGTEGVWPPPPAPPPGERPPAIVLVHGHTGDQVGMSGLARSLAQAGFAVLTLDLRGHGRNRRPFDEGAGRADQFALEIDAAVDFLRSHPEVDGSRIALAGHSMGASAVLQAASRDRSLDAAVMISGGWEMDGPERPANAFFVYAERELPFVADSARAMATRIAGRPVGSDQTYGSVEAGTGVRLHVVPGEDHGSIIRCDETVREIAAWLDRVWGMSRTSTPGFDFSRRLPSQVALAAFLVVLLGVGGVAGRAAARFEPPEPLAVPRVAHLVPIGVSLFAVLPFFALWFPGFLLATSEADAGVTCLASAGLVLLVGLAASGVLAERLGNMRPGALWGSVAVGAATVAAGYVLMVPWAVALRGMSLTPERGVLMLWMGVALLPFTLGFHLLTAGGPPWRGSLVRVLARLLVVAAFSLGIAVGIFGFPLRVFTLVLVVNAVWLELLFGAYYTASRNVLAAAVLEALWLGWQLAAVLTVSL